MATDLRPRIRIDLPLTVSIQGFCYPLKSIEKAVEPERFFVSRLGLLKQSAQRHVAQQREITGAHQFGIGFAAKAQSRLHEPAAENTQDFVISRRLRSVSQPI